MGAGDMWYYQCTNFPTWVRKNEKNNEGMDKIGKIRKKIVEKRINSRK